MSERRVLITGAGGFVGRVLADGFADRGWSVIALDRSFDEAPANARIRRITADLDQGVPAEIPDVDVVVHAAWLTTDPATLGITQQEYEVRNLRPLESVLRFCRATRPDAFLFVSSSGVFSARDATERLTDAHEPTSGAPYARAKRLGEQMVIEGADEMSAALHVVRLGYLYGPHEVARPSRQGVSLAARWVTAARAGQKLEVGSDDPLREWTFAPDLVAVFERIVEHPPAERPLHVSSPHVYHDSELAAHIVQHIPGPEVVSVPSAGAVKPPMMASDVPALADAAWTDLPTGLRFVLRHDAVGSAAEAPHGVSA